MCPDLVVASVQVGRREALRLLHLVLRTILVGLRGSRRESRRGGEHGHGREQAASGDRSHWNTYFCVLFINN